MIPVSSMAERSAVNRNVDGSSPSRGVRPFFRAKAFHFCPDCCGLCQRLHGKRRDFNRLLASERVKVEHTLSSVKRLRILKDEFRNRRKGMADEVMVLGCALHNYRWICRQGTAA